MRCYTVLNNGRRMAGLQLCRRRQDDQFIWGVRIGTLEGVIDGQPKNSFFIPLDEPLQQTLRQLPACVDVHDVRRYVPYMQLDVSDPNEDPPFRLTAPDDPSSAWALVHVACSPGWTVDAKGERTGERTRLIYTSVGRREQLQENEVVQFPIPFSEIPGVYPIVAGGLEPEALVQLAPGARFRIIRTGELGGGWRRLDVVNMAGELKVYDDRRRDRAA